jgi:hypothetical protein
MARHTTQLDGVARDLLSGWIFDLTMHLNSDMVCAVFFDIMNAARQEVRPPSDSEQKIGPHSPGATTRGRAAKKVFLQNEPNFIQAGVENRGERSQKRTQLRHTTGATVHLGFMGRSVGWISLMVNVLGAKVGQLVLCPCSTINCCE